MIIMTKRYGLPLVPIYLCSVLIITTLAANDCDRTKCPGPTMYYNALKCIPVYKKGDNCCAFRYNCDNLKNRKSDKCYIRNHVYNIGEALRAEDSNACDRGCFCSAGRRGIAEFTCAIVDCFNRANPGCYIKNSHTQCCGTSQVCPANETNIATCEVDGKTYLDGQYFAPASEPEKSCYCQKGYKGKNVEPFCKLRADLCGTELRRAYDIRQNCAPVYYPTQSPTTSCNVISRCPNANDTVIRSSSGNSRCSKYLNKEENTCKFGNLTLRIGDQLNPDTEEGSACIKCICEVPPVLTCQRLLYSECDVTVQPSSN